MSAFIGHDVPPGVVPLGEIPSKDRGSHKPRVSAAGLEKLMSLVTRLKLDVFGRTVLIERSGDGWETVYVSGDGKRRRADDIFIPSTIPEAELERFVADLCHEWATPRHPSVLRIP